MSSTGYGFEPIQDDAAGNIGVSLFVKLGSSGWAVASVQGERVDGVSSDAALNAPIPSQSTTYAGEANKPMHVIPPGNIALVTVGSGGITKGTRVMTDSDGTAIAATTTKMAAGLALETASAGELARIRLENTYYA